MSLFIMMTIFNHTRMQMTLFYEVFALRVVQMILVSLVKSSLYCINSRCCILLILDTISHSLSTNCLQYIFKCCLPQIVPSSYESHAESNPHVTNLAFTFIDIGCGVGAALFSVILFIFASFSFLCRIF